MSGKYYYRTYLAKFGEFRSTKIQPAGESKQSQFTKNMSDNLNTAEKGGYYYDVVL